MPRTLTPGGKRRHDPLLVQIKEGDTEEKYGRVSLPGRRKKSRKSKDDDENAEVILDPKTSRRIFELARDQQEEDDMLDDESSDATGQTEQTPHSRTRPLDAYDDDNGEDEETYEEVSDVEKEFEIDAEDMETLDALHPANAGERRSLADIIFAKLNSAEVTVAASDKKIRSGVPDPALGLSPVVVEAYTKLGQFLQKYKSGPLPKLFKVIPSLPAWARMLALTHPENWSPHSCRAATKTFISSMKPPQAQLFLKAVLLPALRQDISDNKKLNPQYYEALQRSLYKPGAFFKAIIFPLLEEGASLKESAIVASVLARSKVPVLHASAALLRIAEMDYSGPNSLFIRVLTDKKFALPYKVVDALVFHFIRLSNTYKAKTRGDTDKLPVLWHQSLLVFVQRYGSDLTPDQKDALLDVIRATPHPHISAEVRRELANTVVRGAPRAPEDSDIVMS